MQEVWRPVVGWEGLYEVSSLGRVKSLARRYWTSGGRVPHWCNIEGRILKPAKTTYGHWFVKLSRNGKAKTRTIHILVAEAFIGPRPEGMEVCHGPNGKEDNTPANLSYGTHSQNMHDCVRDGTHQHGERGSNAKLTSAQVREIRSLKGKMLQREIATAFGISRSCVSMIWSGNRWTSSDAA